MFGQKYVCGGSALRPRQKLLSLDSGKGFKPALLEFLPLFLQKESGFQGSTLRTQKEKRCLHTFYRRAFKNNEKR